jgi:hypothetical protein
MLRWGWEGTMRFLLVAINLIALVAVLLFLKQNAYFFRAGRVEWLTFFASAALLLYPILNLVFVLRKTGTSRIARLVGLWIDAKEADLTRRARNVD